MSFTKRAKVVSFKPVVDWYGKVHFKRPYRKETTSENSKNYLHELYFPGDYKHFDDKTNENTNENSNISQNTNDHTIIGIRATRK